MVLATRKKESKTWTGIYKFITLLFSSEDSEITFKRLILLVTWKKVTYFSGL